MLEYLHKEDTIAGIATAQGAGGIGIIRISGPDAWNIGLNVFRDAKKRRLKNSEIRTREMKLGYVIEPESGLIIDQALCVFFKGPNSYTGQDTVEIQGHGGPSVLEKTLEVIRKNQARQAGPGEFTYRAFQNGKIDLGQAEAICKVIEAGNSTQARLAMDSLNEGLSRDLGGIRKFLVGAAARIDAAIDFPDELDEIIETGFKNEMRTSVCMVLEKLVKRHKESRVFAQGARVVICGRPNVGKSSLFNAVLGRERALVYEKAGTTRDSLEEGINLDGVACRLTDTAGLGEAGEEIEALGMGISREKIQAADLCLVVLDGTQPLNPEDLEILESTKNKECIIAVNKSDKSGLWKMPEVIKDKNYALGMSAKNGNGLDTLTRAIRELLTKGQAEPEPGQATVNQRQAFLLEKCLECCRAALDALEKQEDQIEIASLEIGLALRHLGEVDGDSVPDQVLEEIFSKFCVGK